MKLSILWQNTKKKNIIKYEHVFSPILKPFWVQFNIPFVTTFWVVTVEISGPSKFESDDLLFTKFRVMVAKCFRLHCDHSLWVRV